MASLDTIGVLSNLLEYENETQRNAESVIVSKG